MIVAVDVVAAAAAAADVVFRFDLWFGSDFYHSCFPQIENVTGAVVGSGTAIVVVVAVAVVAAVVDFLLAASNLSVGAAVVDAALS